MTAATADPGPRPSVADQVVARLTPYLGAMNARVSVKTFAQRTLNVAPEGVTLDHLPRLLDALLPMLNTFVGRTSADVLVAAIRREVR